MTSTPMTQIAVDSYLNLLARALTRYGLEPDLRPSSPTKLPLLQKMLARADFVLARPLRHDLAAREEGRDQPGDAETMVGLARLANLRQCIERVVADGVPGDVLETGVWRGGASIFATAVLAALGVADRQVWLADSFRGLPEPDRTRYGHDVVDLSDQPYLEVSRAEVEANFAKYGLLADNVHFLEGWFADTMPSAPIDRLGVLRLDGDLYSSTMDVLLPMYDKVSAGGYVIIDDFGALGECRHAVEDFRSSRGITEPIQTIDWTGAYWRKAS